MTSRPDDLGANLPPELQGIFAPDKLESARQAGVGDDVDPLEGIPFDDPASDEHHVGELTDDEARMFANFYHASVAAEQWDRREGSGLLRSIADAIEQGGDPSELLKGKGKLPPDIERRIMYEDKADAYRKMFFVMVRERLNLWGYRVYIRTERRITKGPRKY